MILIIIRFGGTSTLNSSKNYQCFEKLYHTLERYPNTSKLVEKTRLRLVFFDPVLSV